MRDQDTILLEEAYTSITSKPSQKGYKYILYGDGSGNVYGVSNAENINAAIKEFIKNTHTIYDSNVSEWPEGDSLADMGINVKTHGDGYARIESERSDEGSFGVVDINSPDPSAQKEIQTLGLLKYADEYLRNNVSDDF